MKSKLKNTSGGDAEKNFRFFWKVGLGLSIMVIFLWIAFRRIPFSDFIGHLKEVNIASVLWAISIILAPLVLRGWRWKLMLSSSDLDLRKHHAVAATANHAVAATAIGCAVNMVIPRCGEVARAIFLKKFAHTSLTASLSAVLAERLLDMASLFIFFVLTLIFYQYHLEEIYPGMGRAMIFVALATLTGLMAIWKMGDQPELALRLIKITLAKTIPSQMNRFSNIAENFFSGLQGMFIRENAAGMIILSVGLWVLYVFASWIIAGAFSSEQLLSLSLLDAAVITFVVAIAFTIPVPGGTGITHLFISKLLTTIYSIDLAEALAYATVLHLSGVIPILILGSIIPLIVRPTEPSPCQRPN